MKQLHSDGKLSIVTAPSADSRQEATNPRLVVLVSDIDSVALLAARILAFSASRRLDVVLFGMPPSSDRENELRRKLALLMGFVRDAGVRAEVRLANPSDVSRHLKAMLLPEDQLGCCPSSDPEMAGHSWMDILATGLGRDMIVFESGAATQATATGLLKRALPWILSLAVILGFFWLQVRVVQAVGDGATLPLMASVPVEVGLVLLCNSLTA